PAAVASSQCLPGSEGWRAQRPGAVCLPGFAPTPALRDFVMPRRSRRQESRLDRPGRAAMLRLSFGRPALGGSRCGVHTLAEVARHAAPAVAGPVPADGGPDRLLAGHRRAPLDPPAAADRLARELLRERRAVAAHAPDPAPLRPRQPL